LPELLLHMSQWSLRMQGLDEWSLRSKYVEHWNIKSQKSALAAGSTSKHIGAAFIVSSFALKMVLASLLTSLHVATSETGKPSQT
jgi:hypothetical protein